MPEAHTQQRRSRAELADDFIANAGFVWRARTGRDDDFLGLHCGDFVDGDFVVALYHGHSAEFPEVLHEVVGEAVVVIDDQEHGNLKWVTFPARERWPTSCPSPC